MRSRAVEIQVLGISVSDVAELADAFSGDFGEVKIQRRPSPPAASPFGFEYSAVLLALSIASHGFLGELGKDVYKGLRELIVKAAHRGLRVRNNRGGFTLGIRVERPSSYILFVFGLPPTEEELRITLPEIPQLVQSTADEATVCIRYDPSKGSWGEPEVL